MSNLFILSLLLSYALAHAGTNDTDERPMRTVACLQEVCGNLAYTETYVPVCLDNITLENRFAAKVALFSDVNAGVLATLYFKECVDGASAALRGIEAVTDLAGILTQLNGTISAIGTGWSAMLAGQEDTKSKLSQTIERMQTKIGSLESAMSEVTKQNKDYAAKLPELVADKERLESDLQRVNAELAAKTPSLLSRAWDACCAWLSGWYNFTLGATFADLLKEGSVIRTFLVPALSCALGARFGLGPYLVKSQTPTVVFAEGVRSVQQQLKYEKRQAILKANGDTTRKVSVKPTKAQLQAFNECFTGMATRAAARLTAKK